mgnify:CR=1 FL=1
MAASKIQIWNMALGFIGTRTVASETEHTPEAIQCGLFWDSARRQVLRDYPYNFAQARKTLAAVKVPDVYAEEWRFAYKLPDLCLKAHRIYGRERREVRRIPFTIVSSDDGTEILLTDMEAARLDYTWDVTDVARWDDLFIAMMARKLAALIGVPLLKNNSTKVQELEQLYRTSLPKAMESNASERHDREPLDTWLLSRGGCV